MDSKNMHVLKRDNTACSRSIHHFGVLWSSIVNIDRGGVTWLFRGSTTFLTLKYHSSNMGNHTNA